MENIKKPKEKRKKDIENRRGGGGMWYLCVFYHRLLDYRKPEVESLAELFRDKIGKNEPLEWKLPHHYHPDSPFHFVNLPSEDIARNIANRSQFNFFFLLVI